MHQRRALAPALLLAAFLLLAIVLAFLKAPEAGAAALPWPA